MTVLQNKGAGAQKAMCAKIIVVKAGGWIFFVRDTCGAGTGCMFQK
jgi:hypothetical protein